jgi:hypothetical protein
MNKKAQPAQLAFAGVVAPDIDPDEHWKGMPEYTHDDLLPVHQVIVSFESVADVERFAAVLGQHVTVTTKSIWYPDAEIGRYAGKAYVDAGTTIPDLYPVERSMGEPDDDAGA